MAGNERKQEMMLAGDRSRNGFAHKASPFFSVSSWRLLLLVQEVINKGRSGATGNASAGGIGAAGFALVCPEVEDLELLHITELVGELHKLVVGHVELPKLFELLCCRWEERELVALEVDHLH